MARQLGSAMNPNIGKAPAALTASANGSGVNGAGYQEMVWVALVGAVSGTTPTLDVKITESATSGGTYADPVGGAKSFAQITDATHAVHVTVPVNPAKPFQRAEITIGGTTPSFTMAVAALRCNSDLLPAAAGS